MHGQLTDTEDVANYTDAGMTDGGQITPHDPTRDSVNNSAMVSPENNMQDLRLDHNLR